MPTLTEDDFDVRDTSPDDCYFLDLWPKMFEATIARSNEAIARLLTLATALAGGSVLLLKEDVCYGWWRFGAAAFFFLALGVAVCATVPTKGKIEYNPTRIREALSQVADVKRKWVVGASGCLLLGMLSAVIGFGVRLYVGP